MVISAQSCFDVADHGACPECGSHAVMEDTKEGNIVCTDCGIVLSSTVFDLGEEYRTFDDHDGPDRTRVGGPSDTLFDSAPQTGIGAAVGSRGAGALGRAQQRSALSQVDRARSALYGFVDELCVALGAPPRSVGAAAKEFLIQYTESQLVYLGPEHRLLVRDGRELCAAAVYAACRGLQIERSFKEFAAVARIPWQDIGAALKKIDDVVPAARRAADRCAETFAARFCNKLSLPFETVDPVQRLATELQETVLAGRTLATLTAVAMYVVCIVNGTKKTPCEIANACCIREGTIIKAYKRAHQDLKVVLPKVFPQFTNFKALPPARKRRASRAAAAMEDAASYPKDVEMAAVEFEETSESQEGERTQEPD